MDVAVLFTIYTLHSGDRRMFINRYYSTPTECTLARSYAAEQMRIVQAGAEREDLLGGTSSEMIKLHATRLMRGGAVALWHDGKIVWSGCVGTEIRRVQFDAVTLNTDDGVRMSALLGGVGPVTAEAVLGTLAEWWS
jgi:hypothetical protein